MLCPEPVDHRITNRFSPAPRGAMLIAMITLVAVSQVVAVRPAAAAEETVKLLVRDVACAPGDTPAAGDGPTLDLYGPVHTGGPARSIVLFVHGGGWRHGDKAHVGAKPEAFVSRGYLFASVGYRLDASVTPREQGADVAAAVAWLRAHAADYGAGEGIFLIGHSAGAHLAALVATDARLLARHDLEPAALRGVVLLDGAGYDVPRQIAAARLPPLERLYRTAFGDDQLAQREASPIAHVVAGRRYPPFLLFHVGRRRDSREQAEALAERLRSVGGEATTVHEPDKNHLTLNREFGVAGDGPTSRVLAFLEGR